MPGQPLTLGLLWDRPGNGRAIAVPMEEKFRFNARNTEYEYDYEYELEHEKGADDGKSCKTFRRVEECASIRSAWMPGSTVARRRIRRLLL